MEITFLELIVFGLASFRLTRLFVYDKITSFIRSFFINEIEEVDKNGEKSIYLVPKDGWLRSFFGELLSCYWCTGIWASTTLYILYILLPAIAVPLLVVLAVSGIASIIETILQIWI